MVTPNLETPAQDPIEPGAAPEAPAPAPSPDPAPVAATPPEGGDPAPIAAFTPNPKFKVMDKEHEIDPTFLGAIKDKDSETKFRQLYEKALGLDHVKPKYEQLKERVASEYQPIMNGIMELRECYQRGDLDSFFAKLKIPQEKILQYVVDKINYNELPPEQKQILDAKRDAERRALEATKGNQSMQAEYLEQLTQARGQLLDMTLARGDVSAFGKIFEEKTGKSFRDAICDYAEAVHSTRKDPHGRPVDLSPEQAIKEVMEHYGKFISMPDNGANPLQSPTGMTTRKKEPPVIPNVGGKSTSPTVQVAKSIDDLKKAHARLTGK